MDIIELNNYPYWLVYYIIIFLAFVLAAIIAIPIYIKNKNFKEMIFEIGIP